MPHDRPKRIVFEASPKLAAALEQTAASLELSKIGAIRLAVAILAEIAREASRGGKIILRDAQDHEREIWLPQIHLGEPPADTS